MNPTPAANDAETGEAEDGWGAWRYDRTRSTLVGPYSYEIDVNGCDTAGRTIAWIFEAPEPVWGDDAALAGLVRALSRVAGPNPGLRNDVPTGS